jgi:hypothetical protein
LEVNQSGRVGGRREQSGWRNVDRLGMALLSPIGKQLARGLVGFAQHQHIRHALPPRQPAHANRARWIHCLTFYGMTTKKWHIPEIHEPYHRPMSWAFWMQFVHVLLALTVMDFGFFAGCFGLASLCFWLVVAMLSFRRPRPTAVERFLIMIGPFLIFWLMLRNF